MAVWLLSKRELYGPIDILSDHGMISDWLWIKGNSYLRRLSDVWCWNAILTVKTQIES